MYVLKTWKSQWGGIVPESLCAQQQHAADPPSPLVFCFCRALFMMTAWHESSARAVRGAVPFTSSRGVIGGDVSPAGMCRTQYTTMLTTGAYPSGTAFWTGMVRRLPPLSARRCAPG